jgi:hypothetical protein
MQTYVLLTRVPISVVFPSERILADPASQSHVNKCGALIAGFLGTQPPCQSDRKEEFQPPSQVEGRSPVGVRRDAPLRQPQGQNDIGGWAIDCRVCSIGRVVSKSGSGTFQLHRSPATG